MLRAMLEATPPKKIDLDIRLSRFHLPPVESALAIGRRAPIGANAMSKAMEEMMPGAFRKIVVEHATVEALLVREAHLNRVPEERLVPLLLSHVEAFMADTEMLHIDVQIQVRISETIEV